MTIKSIELVDIMKRRRINIAYLKEIERKGDKGKELTNSYKLYYIGNNNARNGVRIVVDKDLKEKIVGVKRVVIDLGSV